MQGYRRTAQGTYRKEYPNGDTLYIDPPNYQAMYNVRLWRFVDGEIHSARIVIGGCETLQEVAEEAEAWVASDPPVEP